MNPQDFVAFLTDDNSKLSRMITLSTVSYTIVVSKLYSLCNNMHIHEHSNFHHEHIYIQVIIVSIYILSNVGDGEEEVMNRLLTDC